MARTIQTIALFALLAVVAWFLRGMLLLVFAGALFGLALRGCAESLARLTRLPITLMIWTTVLLTAFVIVLGLAFGGGAVAAQSADLWKALQDAFATTLRELSRVPAVATAVSAFDPSTLLLQAGRIVAGAGGLLSGAFGAALAVVIVVFVAVAGALEPSLYRDGFVRLFAPNRRPEVASAIDEIVRTLYVWLLARAVSMCVTGLLVTIGLTLLHIPLAGALGVLAGALAFVPNIGAFIAGAPAVVIAFSIGPRLALAVLVMYWLVHFIDDFFASPLIERKMVRLPPILTLVAQIALTLVGGTIGVMLAAPAVVVSMILVQRFWIDPLERIST